MIDNSWQSSMYDRFFAKETLDSKSQIEKAEKEVTFLKSILNLPGKSKILDVPCGTGRHSLLLAQEGFEVLGIDLSPDCIDIARSKSQLENLSYELGDMKNLSKFNVQFDCVLNLFSSFGYFSTDEENEAVLEGMIRTLLPNGKLIVNVINREWLLSIYKSAFWFKTGSVLTVNANSYDPKSHYNESYVTLKNESGETTLSYHRMRLYSPEEILNLFSKFGLKEIETYGSYEGEKLDMTKSSHPFYIGKK